MKFKAIDLIAFMAVTLGLGRTAPATLEARAPTGVVDVKLKLDQSMYFVKGLSLGKPEQELENTILDTGSSDLVVAEQIFSPDKSSTFNDSDQEFPTQYGSTAEMNITEGTDTVTGSGWQISDYIFGYTSGDLDSFSGILGVGYQTNEALPEYKNFPARLKSDGLVNVEIFSLDGSESAPSVVFGGVDKNAFQAPLVKTPIPYEIGFRATRSYRNVLAVTVNSARLGKTLISDQTLMYTIDSGANVFAVSEPVYENIVTSLGESFTKDNTTYFPQSALASEFVTLNVTGFEVKFPLSDIIDETILHEGETYSSLRITSVVIGEDSYEGTIPNSILKYTYVVYDLETNNIFLAPLKKSTSSRSLVAISGTDSFPVETTEAPYYSHSYTSIYNVDSEITVSASGSVSSDSSVSSYSSSTSDFAQASNSLSSTKASAKDEYSTTLKYSSRKPSTGTASASSSSSTPSIGICYRRH